MSSSSSTGSLLAGRREGESWLRVEGRGNHLLAPAFKQWAKHELAQGQKVLLLDLESCQGLDSTFLGTLAALIFEAEEHGAKLSVVRAAERCLTILERMGMSQLTRVYADLGPHAAAGPELADAMSQWQARQDLTPVERARFALEAHRQLQQASPGNRLLFTDVIELLEEAVRQEGGAEGGN